MSERYRKAGVDIEAGAEFARWIGERSQGVSRVEMVGGPGGFSGLFDGAFKGMKRPWLAACTDGVGTKLLVAFATGCHDTVGIDLVAMNVNDLICSGAEPLFFLDYIACGRLRKDVLRAVMAGILEGCRQAGCGLLGGETAEMPGLYAEGQYDLAGFAVGVVEADHAPVPARVRPGHRLLGLRSSGFHSNGYSLIRRIFLEEAGWSLTRVPVGWERSVGEELLAPTRIYVDAIMPLIRDNLVDGIAHITGGGLTDNVPRMLAPGCGVVIERGVLPVPLAMRTLSEVGRVSDAEMCRVFNMGIGLVLAVAPAGVDEVVTRLAAGGEMVVHIGEVVSGVSGVRYE